MLEEKEGGREKPDACLGEGERAQAAGGWAGDGVRRCLLGCGPVDCKGICKGMGLGQETQVWSQ